MKLSRRTNPYTRQTEEGMVLVATRTARHPQLQFPPLEFVHGDEPVEEVAIGPKGTSLHLHRGAPRQGQKPYALAMVDFEPSVRAFGRLILDGGNAPKIGGTVRVVPFDLADGTADYAFEAVTGVSK